MKDLSSLIDAVCDVEAKADAYLHPYTDHCAVARYCIHDILNAYKAGACSQAPLAEALREATDTLRLMPRDGYASRSLERIRAILEKAVGGYGRP